MLAPAAAANRSGRYLATEFVTVLLGEAYWRAGKVERARETLEEVIALIEPHHMRFWGGVAHRLLGEILSADDPAGAAARFERGLALLQETNAQPELALAYAGYGRFHAQHGRVADAREYLTRALEIFERLGTLGEPDTVRAELAGLSST